MDFEKNNNQPLEGGTVNEPLLAGEWNLNPLAALSPPSSTAVAGVSTALNPSAPASGNAYRSSRVRVRNISPRCFRRNFKGVRSMGDMLRMENVPIAGETVEKPAETSIALPFYTTCSTRRGDPTATQTALAKRCVLSERESATHFVSNEPVVVLPHEERSEVEREEIEEEPPPDLSDPGVQNEEDLSRLRQMSLERKENQALLDVAKLRRKLSSKEKKKGHYSFVSSVRLGVICTLIVMFLFALVMHVVLLINSNQMAKVESPKDITGSMDRYAFMLLMGIVADVLFTSVLSLVAYILFWRRDTQFYIDAIQLARDVAKEFQHCRGMQSRTIDASKFNIVNRCGCQWRSQFARLIKSISIASRKVESLNELVEMAEAEEWQDVNRELPPFNVLTNTTPASNNNHRPTEQELKFKLSFREASSVKRSGTEVLNSQRGISRSEPAEVEKFDISPSRSPAAQKDAVASGEIGPMVVYIICHLFLYDTVEGLKEVPDEVVSANLRQMSNTFNDAVTHVAASSGGVVVGVELDSAIITYNAFSPVPAVSAMNIAYKAAIALEQELTTKKMKLTCDGSLKLSWGIVLQHCRLLVDHGGTEYVKQPYVYSPELEFSFQVVELCRILQCPILSLASSSQSNRTLQIVPVDVIGLETAHTMFLYELKFRKPGENRFSEDKMIDGLLQVHNHKFDEALETLKDLKDSNHSAKRLHYLASYLKKLVQDGTSVPNPYFRAGPSWEFLEMLVMKQEYGKVLEGQDKAFSPTSDAFKTFQEKKNFPPNVQKLDFSVIMDHDGESNDLRVKGSNNQAFGSTVEKNPSFQAFQPSSAFPFAERDDAFADIEQLESLRIEDELISTREAPPSSYSRRGSYSQSLNMNFKITSLQSSIVVGSSTRLHMVTARKAHRAVVVTGNEPMNAFQSEPETLLLKFILGDLIAEGAGGREVYRGLHPNGRIVAIKKVPIFEKSIDLTAAERELGTLARLKHPNILRYIASCYTEDIFYIIMEYISGGSLTDLIRNFGALPKEAIRRYAMESLSGLEYLHRRGIVHRDISTNNIMVTIDGECKIADFGGAFLSSEHESTSESNNSFVFQWSTTFLDMSASVDSSMNIAPPHITARPSRENVFGTPVYMSPQAAQGIVDPKNDIWSLGIALCYCSTGDIPFKEEDLTAPTKIFLDNLSSGKVRPVIPSGKIDRGLENLISMCLSEELADRPTASQLLKNPYILQGNSRKSIKGPSI